MYKKYIKNKYIRRLGFRNSPSYVICLFKIVNTLLIELDMMDDSKRNLNIVRVVLYYLGEIRIKDKHENF